MKQLKLNKVIAGLLVALSVVATVPMQAHAAWRHNSVGWWNTEGNSGYSVGWRNIGGSWYYFWDSGYMATGWIQYGGQWFYLYPSSGAMAHDTTINGYYLGSNGAWTTSNSGYASKGGGVSSGAGDGSIAGHNRK